jgi:hypothetical protein
MKEKKRKEKKRIFSFKSVFSAFFAGPPDKLAEAPIFICEF